MSQPVMVDRVARFLEATSVSRETQTMDELSQRMGDGEGLPAICKGWDVPYSRMLSWLMADEKRYAVYERALEVAAHALIAETVAIADEQAEVVKRDGSTYDPDVARDKLRVDTRFKKAQFHAREKYGEKAQQGVVLPHVQINIGVRVAPGQPGNGTHAAEADVGMYRAVEQQPDSGAVPEVDDGI